MAEGRVITLVTRGVWRVKLFAFLVKVLVVVMEIANSLGRRSGKPEKMEIDFVVKCRTGSA